MLVSRMAGRKKEISAPVHKGFATSFAGTLEVAGKLLQHMRPPQSFFFCDSDGLCFACIGQSDGIPSSLALANCCAARRPAIAQWLLAASHASIASATTTERLAFEDANTKEPKSVLLEFQRRNNQ